MSDRIAVMSAGRVLQVGAPRDIYERPARRFVADFIGEINILDTRVLGASPTGLTLELPGGARIEARAPEDGHAGETAAAAIRPEAVELIAGEAEGLVSGAVENVVYFGAGANVHVGLPDGKTFVARGGGGAAWNAGDKVSIRIPDEAAQVLVD